MSLRAPWTGSSRKIDARETPTSHVMSRGAHRRVSRWALSVAIIGLVVTGLPFVTAPPTEAALWNVSPADSFGAPQGAFRADDALFVTMTSDTDGGWVCIVDESVLDPSTVTCDTTAWGKAKRFIGVGTLLGFPMAAPMLKVGKWRLLTAGNDKKGVEVSDVFTVRPCAGACDTAPAQAIVDQWKVIAGNKSFSTGVGCYLGNVKALTNAFNAARGMYALAGAGLMGFMVGGAWGAMSFFNDITTEDMALSLYRDVSCGASLMFAGIAADPPDPNFGSVAAPVIRTLPLTGDSAYDNLFAAYEQAAGYGTASRIAFERYQGAMAANDDAAAAMQAAATSDFTAQLANALRQIDRLQPAVEAKPIMATPTVDVNAAEGNAVVAATEYAERVSVDGFTPEEIAAMKALPMPLSDDQIASVRSQIIAGINIPGVHSPIAGVPYPQTIDPAMSLKSAMQAVRADMEASIDAFDAFGRSMSVVAAELRKSLPDPEPNKQPVSAFSASPVTGSSPLTVTFTSQASDPDNDALSLRWDIGGARIVQDQQTVTHTFTSPGEYWVSLVATDPGGLWHQAVKKITVYPGGGGSVNQAPVADFTPKLVDGIGPFDQIFSATSVDPLLPLSFDPDGDQLSFTWHFGDGTTQTGETVTKTFQPGYVMSVLLVVSDGKLSAQASGEVTSRNTDGTPPANDPPIAAFTADPATGAAPLQVLFSSTSSDTDGDSLTHTWYFGDGQTSSAGRVVAHSYAFPGTYTVTLVVTDGRASTSTTREVTATQATAPLHAALATSKEYDVAKATNGARMLDTGVPERSADPASNLIMPTGIWQTPANETSEQDIIIQLAGDGRDLIDRVAFYGYNSTASVQTVSVALTQGPNPFGGYTTVLDRGHLARINDLQTFPLATPQTATFAKITVHDNYGANSFRLHEFFALTADRDGGIVSVDAGRAPTIESVSSEYNATYSASKILTPENSYWSTPQHTVTDQKISVRLGGDGPHTIRTIALRGSTSARSVKDFEVWISDTGSDGSWSNVLEGTLQNNASLQEFALAAPVDAGFVELRLTNNHGDANYMYLYELRVLTTHGLNVADGSGVGAQIASVSNENGSNSADKAIAPDITGSFWRTANGKAVNQSLTVLLRNGDEATIDRVSISSGAAQPKTVDIQVSIDGTTYTTVASQQLFATATEQSITFQPVRARFVKLIIEDGYSATYVRVDRFRVFATDRGNGTNVPFVDLSTGTPTTWAWDFGDSSTSTEQHPVHTFSAPGTYPVTLTVTDAGGAASSAAGSYTVPALPTVTIETATETVNEGANVPLVATTDGTPAVEWDWDFDYIKPATRTATATAKFPDDGSFTVTARGLTPDGLWTAWASKNLSVLNVPPTVNAGSPVSGLASDPIVPAVVTVTDPADTLTCTWNWGDGTPEQTIAACTAAKAKVPHTYALPGVYTATLTADDGDLGGRVSSTLALTALHRPTFAQFTSTEHTGSGTRVTARLYDSSTGAPVPSADVTLGVTGSTSNPATTDAAGTASVLLEATRGSDELTFTFAGNALHASADLQRVVDAPIADIVFAVDESGSMSGYQKAIQANIRTINQGLGAHLDYRLGLVGYAHPGPARIMTELTGDMSTFTSALSALDIYSGYSANTYEAVVTSTHADMNYRPFAAACVVAISDASVSEASGTPQWDKDGAITALAERDATFFGVLPIGDIQDEAFGIPNGLAGVSGGKVWNISRFTTDTASILDALVAKCVTKAQVPDLALTMTVDPTTPMSPTDTVTYTLTASNAAATPLTGITIVDTLPAGTTFVSADNDGTYNTTTRKVTWPTTFDLAIAATTTRTITVTHDNNGLTPGNHDLTNTATATDDGTRGTERTMANNTATATITLQVPEPDPEVPDLALTMTVDPTTPVSPTDTVTYTLTASNAAATPLTGITIVDTLPAGTTFVSADNDGTYNTTTRKVTWPTFELAIAATTTRTITVTHDNNGLTPGNHDLTNTATATDDGTHGTEHNTANNTATATITLQVPTTGPAAIDAAVRTSSPAAVEPSAEFGYTLTVSNEGTAGAADVSVLQHVPDRVEIVTVALPDGWSNPAGTPLVGAHPDGHTPGVWLHLTGVGVTDDVALVVTARLIPLTQSAVIDDDGPLDANLPSLAHLPPQDLTARVCVSTDGDQNAKNDCTDVRVVAKDLVAEVTVRLFEGIAYLIASVDTAASLGDLPVTLTWNPGEQGAEPAQMELTNLQPGQRYVVKWPGAAFAGGGAVDVWPGWRALTAADTDANGNALHPVTHEVLTETERADMIRGNRILDQSLASSRWRSPSTVTFSVNPSIDFTVTYREALPTVVQPEPQPGTTVVQQEPQPGTTVVQSGPTVSQVPATTVAPGTPDLTGELPHTGSQGIQQLVLFGLLLLLIGTVIHRRARTGHTEL